MAGLETVLDAVLSADRGAYGSLGEFRAAWMARRFDLPVDHALVGGALADRLGYAFAAGYAAALRRLVPALGDTHACLCVTERGGAHPRAIQTTVEPDGDGFRVTGAKRWATLAGEGDVLLVAASAGREGERNTLRVVAVPATAEGVRRVPMPPTPFTPEIPHSEIVLEGARVGADALLPGDGYERYVKPFRTVEDVHVTAAATGYLLRAGLAQGWPRDVVTRLTALAVAVRALGEADPSAPTVHVAVAGALATLRALAEAAPWAEGSDEAGRWQRDLPLLQIAEAARSARLDAAMSRLAARA